MVGIGTTSFLQERPMDYVKEGDLREGFFCSHLENSRRAAVCLIHLMHLRVFCIDEYSADEVRDSLIVPH